MNHLNLCKRDFNDFDVSTQPKAAHEAKRRIEILRSFSRFEYNKSLKAKFQTASINFFIHTIESSKKTSIIDLER